MQRESERGVRAASRPHAQSRHACVAAIALVLLLAGCSSGGVDESALPAADAPTIGLAIDAKLTDPSPDLPAFDDANGFAGVPAGGRYQIGLRNTQSVVTSILDEDFPVEQVVRAAFDTTGSPDDIGFGVVCRKEDDDNYYRLGVGNDGTYAIQRVEDGTTTVLTGNGKWIESKAIRDEPGRFTVRAECVGDTVTLYADNQQIASVRDTSVQGNQVGVFLESFFKPESAVQVDALSVRARDRGRMSLPAAQSWDAVVRAQQVSTRCSLLDPKRAGVSRNIMFVTRCGSAIFLQAAPAGRGAPEFARILEETGTAPTSVKALPDCPKRAAIMGPLPAPTAAAGAGTPAGIGEVACLDLGDATAVVWVHDDAGVIGVSRVQQGDRTAWEDYGPDWLPFVFVEKPA